MSTTILTRLFVEFGQAAVDLDEARRIVLVADVQEIILDEERTAEDAVKVLRTRIGGPKNLKAYTDSLVARVAAEGGPR